ncbi:MAG: DUF86 domain-containing protein [Coriobacteriia bacterium]|nr:DUF86 domain-containing protein [Coriobacteriia bacterium]
MAQDRTIEQFLSDMHETAQGIAAEIAKTDRDTFLNTVTGSWAVERGVIQMGEIAVQMRERHPDFVVAHPALDPEGMRGARNIVVHGYAVISRERVWSMAINRAPEVGELAGALLRALAAER